MTGTLDFLRWWIPWEPSALVVLVFVPVASLYWRGARRSPVTAPWYRQLPFWLGLLIVYTGLHTRLDYYAEHEFFIHRIQHMGLHHMGPFLIALGYPGPTMRRGLPVHFRKHWLNPALAWAPLRESINVLLHPLVAATIFVGLIYLWLWPALHFYAMLDWRLYRVMNFSMALDGMLFWWLVLDHRPRPPARLSPGTRVLLLIAVIVPQILIGSYISFTNADLYPIYSLCGRAFAHIPPLMDQHLGGLILWIPSSMMSAIGALLALRFWLRLDSRGRLSRSRRARAALETRDASSAERTSARGRSHA